MQLTQGLIPQRNRRKTTKNSALVSAGSARQNVFAPPASCPDIDVTYPDVSPHRPLLSVPQFQYGKENLEASNNAELPPRYKTSIPLKLSERCKTPLTGRRPFSTRPCQASQDVHATRRFLGGKLQPVASSVGQDSISERFKKLRLPQTRAAKQKPIAPAMRVHSPQTFFDDSLDITVLRPLDDQEWFDPMDSTYQRYVPIPVARAFSPLPWNVPSQPQQAPLDTTPVIEGPIATEKDEYEEVGLQPSSPFSHVNYFQSSRYEPSQDHRDRAEAPVPRRRSKSPTPEIQGSDSEGPGTPRSSDEVSDPLVSESFSGFGRWSEIQEHASAPLSPDSKATIDVQWQMALDLQKEEDYERERRAQEEAMKDPLQQFNFTFSPELEVAACQQFSMSPPSRKRTRISRMTENQKPVRPFRGTQSNPIDLTSDSDGKTCYATYFDTIANIEDFAMAKILRQEENERNERGRARKCVVCGDRCSVVAMPALSRCSHDLNFCPECYQNWIAAQLEDSSWREAKCPEQHCHTMLTYLEIQQHASTETFQQYDKFLTRAACNEDPNFRWCRACESGQIHMSGVEGNIFTCRECGDKICTIHDTWHEGETCSDYEYRASGRKDRDQQAQEEASLAAISRFSKKCPGEGCVYNIEKSSGCDHMTCSNCKHEFCWVCLCDYERVRSLDNSEHARDCKYYA